MGRESELNMPEEPKEPGRFVLVLYVLVVVPLGWLGKTWDELGSPESPTPGPEEGEEDGDTPPDTRGSEFDDHFRDLHHEPHSGMLVR